MSSPTSDLRDFRKIFEQSITIKDIAEPLVCFSHRKSARTVATYMENNDFDVAGVNKDGLVVGYVDKADLAVGQLSRYLKPFEESDLLGESASVATLVNKLSEKPCVFATAFGRVGGIVTHADMQKAPVRMWMFGLVSLLELQMQQSIESSYSEEEWIAYLSPGRIEKAKKTYQELTRKNEAIDLINCLEYADKREIFCRSEKLFPLTGFSSKTRLSKSLGSIINLRNDLVHVHDLTYKPWLRISRVLADCESLLVALAKR